MNYNKILLIGNVVSNPVVFERSGKYIVSFVMGTRSKSKNEDGALISETDFHDVTHMTTSREYAHNIKQNARVFVEGELKSKKGPDGKFKWKIKAYNMQYGDPKSHNC